jgi:O-antigen ligase
MKWFNNINRQLIAWWCSAAIIIGLLFSKFLISVGMIVLIVIAVVNPRLRQNLQLFFKNPAALFFTAVFFVYLISGINSADQQQWLERLRIKLPFLILPFAFVSLVPFTHRQFMQLLFLLWLMMFGGTCYSIFHYINNMAAIHENYHFAKVIPTPIDHIRFSMLLAISCVAGCYLINKNFIIRFKQEKWLLILFTFIQFAALHLLAVRSGLLSAYLVIIYSVFYFLAIKKQYLYGFSILAAMFVFPLLSIWLLPTLSIKLQYMQYDLLRFFDNQNVNGFSDGNRLTSWQLAWQSIQSNWLIGVGIGDVKTTMQLLYATYFPQVLPENRLMPHNQFLLIWMGTGIIGLLVFLISIIYIIIQKQNYKKWLFASLWMIVLSALFTEPLLEIQVGTAIFLYFILLFNNQYKFVIYNGR